nr:MULTISPECIES: cytochrome ubiquinol oxidase subunit I [unclassified Streptomyces]
MLLIGILMLFLNWIPAMAVRGKAPDESLSRRRFRLFLPVILLPAAFLAVICGWLSREVGRQPWMVTGELTVRDAVADTSPGGMLASLVVFTLVLGTLALIDWVLIFRYARLGPDAGLLGDAGLFPDATEHQVLLEDALASPSADVRHSY